MNPGWAGGLQYTGKALENIWGKLTKMNKLNCHVNM